MSQPFLAAVVQDAPVAFDLQASVARAVQLVAEAAARGRSWSSSPRRL